MAQARYHLADHPLPDGYQIYAERLEVAGIKYRRDDAAAFASKDGGWLELQPDPANSRDPNAIRVIGCNSGLFGTKRWFIGYVPADVSEDIAASRLISEIRPRLLKTYVSDTGFVEVLFQIIGPKTRIHEYRKTWQGETRPVEESEDSLLAAVAEEERRVKMSGLRVSALPHERLAKMYRKKKRYGDEVAILERYQCQPKEPGRAQQRLADRLVRARQLLMKQKPPTT